MADIELTFLTVTADIVAQSQFDDSLPDIAQMTYVMRFETRQTQDDIEAAIEGTFSGNNSFGGLSRVDGTSSSDSASATPATYGGAVLSGWIETTKTLGVTHLVFDVPPSGFELKVDAATGVNTLATTAVLLPDPKLASVLTLNSVTRTPSGTELIPVLPSYFNIAGVGHQVEGGRAAIVWERDIDPRYDVGYVLGRVNG